MRRILERVEADAADPLRYEPRVLPRGQMLITAAATGEQALPCVAVARPQIVVQRLSCDLRQLEPGGAARLSLAHGGAINRVTIRRHIIRAEGDEIAARSLLSIARLNSTRSRVRLSSCSLARISHTWPGRSGGFGPVSLPLFRADRSGVRFDDEELLSFMVSLPV
jgi:hypothetical protein